MGWMDGSLFFMCVGMIASAATLHWRLYQQAQSEWRRRAIAWSAVRWATTAAGTLVVWDTAWVLETGPLGLWSVVPVAYFVYAMRLPAIQMRPLLARA